MKVVFCWSVISGYMAACWRELAARPGIDLHVIAHPSGSSTAFRSELLSGISHKLLRHEEQQDTQLVENLVVEHSPDVLVMTGWWLKPYRQLLHSRRLKSTKFIMGVDSPWRTEVQFLTRFRYRSSLAEVDHFFVTGERSWQYVSRLGVHPSRISRGMYGVDLANWSRVYHQRAAGAWPRQFLFVGRYEEDKAVDVLVEAYGLYRQKVENPWRLVCCGKGSNESLLKNVAGIEDRGFVQPDDLAQVMGTSGAFVIPSRFDPWPLALVEAAASGLPVLASDACGSAVEVVRPYFNGFSMPTNSPKALAWAMQQIHNRESEMPLWGERSHQFASAYSASIWADRWTSVFHRLAG